MPFSRLTLRLSLLIALSATGAPGCSDRFSSCEESKTCQELGGGSGDGDSGTGGDGDATGGKSSTSGGGTGDGDGDGDGDTSGGTGSGGQENDPCETADCEGYCLSESGTAECVECVYGDEEARGCMDGERSICLEDNTCVACTSNEDCTDPAASLCDAETNECGGCENDEGCAHLESGEGVTLVCDEESETCVECTPETEEAQCGEYSCDPATNLCTTTKRGKTKACFACVSDTECIPGHQCVPLSYDGEERGGYCLQVLDQGCARPFLVQLTSRTSLSGALGEEYCGINESLTTCEAVRALMDDFETACTDVADSGDCPEGGLCRYLSILGGNRCTYRCSYIEQCKTSGPGSTCGDGTDEDLNMDAYFCGG